MTNYEEMTEEARKNYARLAGSGQTVPTEPFPEPPEDIVSADGFLDRLLAAAFQSSPKLRHPFAVRLARGEWKQRQIQEWVRQDYQWILHLIRRHSLLAANASDYDILWGLLTRVKAEADADPVGGTFFALPQLWTKFGIALGLTREQVTESQCHPLLRLVNDSLLAEVRFSAALPVRDLVDALLDPIFYQVWGEALESSLRLPNSALDFFWAVAADRWGRETGRSILQRWAGSREAQSELWNRYRAELQQDREWHRFTILQRLLESGPEKAI